MKGTSVDDPVSSTMDRPHALTEGATVSGGWVSVWMVDCELVASTKVCFGCRWYRWYCYLCELKFCRR